MITLRSSMPSGWEVGDSVYARYDGLPFYDEIVESAGKQT